MLDGSEWFECQCGDEEHTIKFVYDSGLYRGDYKVEFQRPEVYLSIFLETDGFFKRFWTATKYIFGYKSRYGHFGNWTLESDDAERLIGFLDRYVKRMEKWKKESGNDTP